MVTFPIVWRKPNNRQRTERKIVESPGCIADPGSIVHKPISSLCCTFWLFTLSLGFLRKFFFPKLSFYKMTFKNHKQFVKCVSICTH